MLYLDPTARAIVNGLQGEFPLTSRPFRDAGRVLGLTEDELIEGVRNLTDSGALSRFGPLWNAEQIGGGVCLAAIAVPEPRFDEVDEKVNPQPEVDHNYERAHLLNMWFVISADDPRKVEQVIAEIGRETGLVVYAMPKAREFFVGFRVEV
jgi:DNA-binding Lrp family transcriptional regulator